MRGQQRSVEEASLTIQVSALRRALGDGQGLNRYIATVVGRGYNFVARIREEEPSQASPPPSIAPAVLHNLPFAITRMIGREEIVTTLVAQLSRQRLVTIVGPGGIGKTTVALAVAERMIAAHQDGVWLVDLAPLRDPSLVPSAVAGVLGLEIRTENPLPALVAAVKNNRMLLLLDNCEHVIDAAADLAEALLGGTSGVNILATSRERLRVSGEGQYRLRPLNSPGPSSTRTVAEAMTFPAVQLFVRASHCGRRRLCTDRCQCPTGRGDLPAARRLAVGHRVRRACRGAAWGRQPCRTPRQHFVTIDRRAAHIKSAPPDHASGYRLELQLIERQGAAASPDTGCLFRRLYHRSRDSSICGGGRNTDRHSELSRRFSGEIIGRCRCERHPVAVSLTRYNQRICEREAS